MVLELPRQIGVSPGEVFRVSANSFTASRPMGHGHPQRLLFQHRVGQLLVATTDG